MIDQLEKLSTYTIDILFYSRNSTKFLFLLILIISTVVYEYLSRRINLRKRKQVILEIGAILLLLIISLFIRTFDLNDPPNGYYAFRQTQTLMVYRNYYEGEVNPLTTQLDMIFQDQEDYEGYVDGFEFNLLPASTVVASKILGDTYYTYRIVVIGFSMLGSVAFYFILKNHFSKLLSYIGALIYSLLPFNVYFGQAYMPDIPSQSLFLVGLALAYLYSDSKKQYKKLVFITASIAICLAMLMKPQSVLFLPVFGIVISKDLIQQLKLNKKTLQYKQVKIAVNVILRSLLPFLLLILFMFYERIIDDNYDYPHSLLNFTAIKNASFRNVVFDYIVLYSIGLMGLTFAALGLVYIIKKDFKTKKLQYLEIYVWLLCTLLFSYVFFLGSVANTYYQINYIPILLLLCLFSFSWLEKKSILVAVPVLAFVILNSTYMYNDFWFHNTTDRNEVLEAGSYMQEISNKEDYIIITDFVTMEPTSLYFAHRKGWIADLKYYNSEQLEDNIGKGAKYFVMLSRFNADLENNPELSIALNQFEHKDFGSFRIYYLHQKQK